MRENTQREIIQKTKELYRRGVSCLLYKSGFENPRVYIRDGLVLTIPIPVGDMLEKDRWL